MDFVFLKCLKSVGFLLGEIVSDRVMIDDDGMRRGTTIYRPMSFIATSCSENKVL